MLTVEGHLSAVEGVAASILMKELVGRDQVAFIGNLGAMTTYDREARLAWQDAFRGKQKQIEKIYICSASPMLRVAAAAVCLYAGIKMVIIDSMNDLPATDRPPAHEHLVA
ncbi:MAG TPA: hypothetical protein VFG69_16335 [Nannocystaceae bacterium]|nr:hypothetical protein [Nannocystaceae bacterium]